ncbi:hypothetical protein [Paenibacillus sp. NPDC055715]
MTKFSEEFKYSIVKRMMPPKNAKSKGMAVPDGEGASERWST